MLFNTLLLTRDFYEGFKAFAEKRKPKYTNEKEKIEELISYYSSED